MRTLVCRLSFTACLFGVSASAFAGSSLEELIRSVEDAQPSLERVAQYIWENPEPGLAERKAAAMLTAFLRSSGFQVKQNVAGMPTAFLASYGKGRPRIGIITEYDALVGVNQNITRTGIVYQGKHLYQYPLPQRDPPISHACGHNIQASAAVGAALAVKQYLERHPQLRGTVVVLGTPAEETLVGKTLMAKNNVFSHPGPNGTRIPDFDVILKSHPKLETMPLYEERRSALSVTGIVQGSSANPPPTALPGQLGQYCKLTLAGPAYRMKINCSIRADTHRMVEQFYDQFTAVMLSLKKRGLVVQSQVTTDVWDGAANKPMAMLMDSVLQEISHRLPQGYNPYSPEQIAFAQAIQRADVIGPLPPQAMDPRIHPLEPITGKPKIRETVNDIGNTSWDVPLADMTYTVFPLGLKNHDRGATDASRVLGSPAITIGAVSLALATVRLLEDSARFTPYYVPQSIIGQAFQDLHVRVVQKAKEHGAHGSDQELLRYRPKDLFGKIYPER